MSAVAARLLLFAVVGVLTPGVVAAQDPAPPPADALFDDSQLRRLDLRLNSADWAKLRENFRENDYYPADLVFAGQTVRNVGVRSRGGGSRSGTKPGLRVDFDRYTTAQTLSGLKSVVLDNLTQDASGIHETLTMKLFRTLGIPAPREAHVRVYVNDSYIGLYALVESIDKDFLARTFGEVDGNVQNDGFLFEYEWIDEWRFEYLGSDLREYKPRFNAQTRDTASDAEKYDPIERMVRAADRTNSDLFVQQLSEYIDLPAFMRFVAALNFVAEKDGFLGYAGMNNFYLYRLEDRPQHVFIAWDNDNSFRSSDWPILAGIEDNVLTATAIRVRELREVYGTALKDAVRASEARGDGDTTGWLEREAQRQLDLIADAMREDPSRPYSYNEHLGAREEMLAFTRERLVQVREQLIRFGFGEVLAAAGAHDRK